MRFMNIRPIILLLALVSAVVIGCSAAPTPVPAPSGPSITEEEAIATVKQHLQSKSFHDRENVVPCWAGLERLGLSDMSGDYDPTAHRWDIEGSAKKAWTAAADNWAVVYSWSLYERTGSVVATGDETLNKLC